MSSISLMMIGFAVVETAKLIAEEEVMRQRELRSSKDSRRTITRFITIIVIASSLEALARAVTEPQPAERGRGLC